MADFINGVLSSMGPDIIQSIADHFLPTLEQIIKDEINNILGGGKTENGDVKQM